MSKAAIGSALETDPQDVLRTRCCPDGWHPYMRPLPKGYGVPWQTVRRSAGSRWCSRWTSPRTSSTASLAIGWTRDDGAAQVQHADHREGTDWIVARALELTKSWGGSLIGANPGRAALLSPWLTATGVKVARSRPGRPTSTPAPPSMLPPRQCSYATATSLSSTRRLQRPGGRALVTPANGCSTARIRGCHRCPSPPPPGCTGSRSFEPRPSCSSASKSVDVPRLAEHQGDRGGKRIGAI